MGIRFSVLTLFPELITQYLSDALLSKALKNELLSVEVVSLRDYSDNKYKSIDDAPYGGGDGMIFRADILEKAILDVKSKSSRQTQKVIYLSPQGKKWDHLSARTWASQPDVEYILVSGRYGGVDQRFIDDCVDEEISLGDFVLSGGELPALAIIESVSRFIPNVLGHEKSALADSFENSLFEAPQYTKPQTWKCRPVPADLVAGHHQKIADWRHKASILQTVLRNLPLALKYFNPLMESSASEVLKKDWLWLNKFEKDFTETTTKENLEITTRAITNESFGLTQKQRPLFLNHMNVLKRAFDDSNKES